MIERNPCPVCGYSRISFIRITSPRNGGCFYECGLCQWSGKRYPLKIMALISWNKQKPGVNVMEANPKFKIYPGKGGVRNERS